MRLALAALAVMIASPAGAEGLPHFAKGTPYKAVRSKLMALGYKPYKAPDADECFSGDCMPEMEHCSSSMTQDCEFSWQKGVFKYSAFTQDDPPKFSAFEKKRS